MVAGGELAHAGQYVKGGFAASEIKATWSLTDVEHWGVVLPARSGNGIAPGGATNIPYYEVTAESHGRKTVDGAIVPGGQALEDVVWCLPPTAIISQQRHRNQTWRA